MMRWIVLVLLFLGTAPAHGQTFRVDSGEHADFSRLVVMYGNVPDWTFGRVPGGYELRPALSGLDYNLARVFNYIPRDRIADVVARPDGRLFVELACACHADAFEIRRGVVIDVKNGPAPPGSVFETALPMPDNTESALENSPAPEPARTPLPESLDPYLASGVVFMETPLRLPLAWDETLALDLAKPDDPATETSTPAEAAPDARDRLAEMQAELVAQISRAAGQGMVLADMSGLEVATAENETPADPEPEQEPGDETAPEPDEAKPDTLEEHRNIRIETAVDRGQTGPPTLPPMTADGAECISDDTLDVPSWGVPPDETGAALSDFRGRIVGEFDEVDQESITALARNYLYLTFGLEARTLLDSFQAEVKHAELYRVLSEIMDNGAAENPGPLADQTACRTRAALWAVLAEPDLLATSNIATEAVLTTYSELPVHLRRHLGPDLVDRFIAVSDDEAAAVVRNALARAPGDHGEAFRMMEAELALETGDAPTGEAELEEIVREDGTLAPEALIRLIDTRLAQGGTVPDKTRDNAAALAYASRGSELGAELMRVYLRALAHGGDIAPALEELGEARGLISAETADALRLEILSLAATEAPDEVFVRTVLPTPLGLGETPEADAARRVIADRLIGLGLTEAARDLLSEDLSVPTPEDRILYARAYVQEQRPDLVIGYLAGLDSDEAKALRARAHELANEYAEAAAAYEELGDEDARARALWRSRDWPAAADAVEGPKKVAAELATSRRALEPANSSGEPPPPIPAETDPAASSLPEAETVEPPDAPDTPLAISRELLERSRETRRVLEDLLTPPEAPES